MRRALAVLTIAATALGLVAVLPAGAGGGGEPRISKAEVRRLREAAQRTLDAGPRKYGVEVLISTPDDPPNPGQQLVPFRAEGVIDPVTGATDAELEVAGELQPAAVAPSAFTGVPAQATPTPEERLRNAVDATVAAGSTSFDGSVDVGQGTPLTFSGASTIDGRDADLTLDFGSVLPTADPLRTISVDGTHFLELEPLASAALTDVSDLPSSVRGKTWVRVEPEEVGQTGVGAQGSDPGAQLAMLRAITKVQEVGPEDVAGEPATHFSGIVDLERALKRAPKGDRPRLQAAFESFGKQRVPVDVWLDSTDRLRRFDATIEAPTLQTDAEASATYSDFGIPVDVEKPARSDVVSYDDFLDAVRESVNT